MFILRITIPFLTLCKGGGQRLVVELTDRLVDRGHDVTILMPSLGAVEYPIRSRLVRTAHTVLRQEDFPYADVILSNFHLTVPPSALASAMGKGKHVRLSMCYEPMFLEGQYLSFPTYHATPHIIALSEYQKSIIGLTHGIEAHTIPVGVSEGFHNMRFRHPHDPLQITAIVRKPEGGFTWHRQQDYLLEQLHIVRQHCPGVEFNLICPPQEFYDSPELQAVKATGLYRFYTPADDRELCYHYNQADIYVAASAFEAAPLPVLESMKCGAALVTVYSGGNMEYCRHEVNCLMSYRYEDRLAADIIRLVRDPALRDRLAAAGEAEASRWSWDRSTDRLEQILKKIVG
ncbi:glycosyltransferase family 4 protein [Gorillibacterium sp. sgz5001074]|uniref:glycosyltransferase family 4 protein n=1 Tax=Gorillibacterium sp. sgz5001074 TaxID=3446695 RepID=UPI003F67A1BD